MAGNAAKTGTDLGNHLGNGLGGRRFTGLRIAAALPLLILLACGGEETPTATPGETPPAAVATPDPAQPPAPAPAAQSAEGVEVSKGELPKGYPADLPQPPSSQPQTGVMVEGKGGLISFASSESITAVVEHFKKTLPEQGWQVAQASEDPARSVIKATKDSRAVGVTVTPARNGAGSSVVVSVKAE